MFRSGASRSALRSFAASSKQLNNATVYRSFPAQIYTAATRRPHVANVAKQLALVRLQSGKPAEGINLGSEAKQAAEKLAAHPELVSATSTTHSVRHELGVQDEPRETEMLAGIKSDIKTIQETFSMKEVPREAYLIGMAGVLPYLATSLSTVYCAFEINSNANHGYTYILSEKQAELFLHILEPLQIGYGATIISFLGAIHWGLEFAAYGGTHGYARYSIGVIATAFAWPTVLLPAQSALITQFLIFNFLYYTDSRATKRGWCPPWYAIYRYVLTFVVGASIILSLNARGQVADRITRPHGPAERIQALRDLQPEEREEEEGYKRAHHVEEDEGQDDEE